MPPKKRKKSAKNKSNLKKSVQQTLPVVDNPPLNVSELVDALPIPMEYYRASFDEKESELIIAAGIVNDNNPWLDYLQDEYVDEKINIVLNYSTSSVEEIIEVLKKIRQKLSWIECFYYIKALFHIELNLHAQNGNNQEKLLFLGELLIKFIEKESYAFSISEIVLCYEHVEEAFRHLPVKYIDLFLAKLNFVSNYIPHHNLLELQEDYYHSEVAHLIHDAYLANDLQPIPLPLTTITQLVGLIAVNFNYLLSIMPYDYNNPNQDQKSKELLINFKLLCRQFLNSHENIDRRVLFQLASAIQVSPYSMAHIANLAEMITAVNQNYSNLYQATKSSLDKQLRNIGKNFTKASRIYSNTAFWMSIISQRTYAELKDYQDSLSEILKDLESLESLTIQINSFNDLLSGLQTPEEVANVAAQLKDPSFIKKCNVFNRLELTEPNLNENEITTFLKKIHELIINVNAQQRGVSQAVSINFFGSEEELKKHRIKPRTTPQTQSNRNNNRSISNQNLPLTPIVESKTELKIKKAVEPWTLALITTKFRRPYQQAQQLFRQAFVGKNSESAIELLIQADKINADLVQQIDQLREPYALSFVYINQIEIITSLLAKYKKRREELSKGKNLTLEKVKKISQIATTEQQLAAKIATIFTKADQCVSSLYPVMPDHALMKENIEQQMEHLKEYFEQSILSQQNTLEMISERIEQLSHDIAVNRQGRATAALNPNYRSNKKPTFRKHFEFLGFVTERAALRAFLAMQINRNAENQPQTLAYTDFSSPVGRVTSEPVDEKEMSNFLEAHTEANTLISEPEKQEPIVESSAPEDYNPLAKLFLSIDDELLFQYLVPVIEDVIKSRQHFQLIQQENKIFINILAVKENPSPATKASEEIMVGNYYTVTHCYEEVNQAGFKIELHSEPLNKLLRDWHVYIFQKYHPDDTLKSILKVDPDTDAAPSPYRR